MRVRVVDSRNHHGRREFRPYVDGQRAVLLEGDDGGHQGELVWRLANIGQGIAEITGFGIDDAAERRRGWGSRMLGNATEDMCRFEYRYFKQWPAYPMVFDRRIWTEVPIFQRPLKGGANVASAGVRSAGVRIACTQRYRSCSEHWSCGSLQPAVWRYPFDRSRAIFGPWITASWGTRR